MCRSVTIAEDFEVIIANLRATMRRPCHCEVCQATVSKVLMCYDRDRDMADHIATLREIGHNGISELQDPLHLGHPCQIYKTYYRDRDPD